MPDSSSCSRRRWNQTARIARGWPQPDHRHRPGPVLRVRPHPSRRAMEALTPAAAAMEKVSDSEESTGMASSRSPVPPKTGVLSSTSSWPGIGAPMHASCDKTGKKDREKEKERKKE